MCCFYALLCSLKHFVWLFYLYSQKCQQNKRFLLFFLDWLNNSPGREKVVIHSGKQTYIISKTTKCPWMKIPVFPQLSASPRRVHKPFNHLRLCCVTCVFCTRFCFRLSPIKDPPLSTHSHTDQQRLWRITQPHITVMDPCDCSKSKWTPVWFEVRKIYFNVIVRYWNRFFLLLSWKMQLRRLLHLR